MLTVWMAASPPGENPVKMYVGGNWVTNGKTQPVRNPFDGSVFDTVPVATIDQVNLAVESAQRGAAAMRRLPAYDRYSILHRAAELLRERREEFAQTITGEEGKIIAEARTEVDRAIQTITLSAEEAKRLYGEVLPLDASPGNATKFGFTLRVPPRCGRLRARSVVSGASC